MTSKSPGFTDTLDADDEAFCSACGRSYSIDYDHCPNDGAALTKFRSRPDLLIGRVFHDRYEVRATLGHGGMGTVYRGWQLSVDREVAIKVIHARLASDRTAVKRFLREARLSSRLSQPSIVNVFDHGQTDDGILFIVMEMLRGHSLSKELAAGEPMAASRVMTMALQLCDALDAAHGENIIHRDLKPGNIVVLDEPAGRDFIKVLDFGLAKTLGGDSAQVTNTDAVLGTPLYMAPEQIASAPTDQRTDLYALGCLLYHMLSGRPPFIADTISAVFARHVHDTAPPLPVGTPPVLAAVVAKLMQKDPARRFTTAMEVRAALEATSVVKVIASVGQADVATAVVRKPVRDDDVGHANTVDSNELHNRDAGERRRGWKIAAVVIAVLVVGASVFAISRFGSSPAQQVGSDAAAASTVPPVVTPADAAIDTRGDVATGAALDAPHDATIDAAAIDAPTPRRTSTIRTAVDAGTKKTPIDASDDPGFINPSP